MVITPLWLNLLQVIALFPIFLALSLLVFYLPGYFILSRSKASLRSDEIIVLGFSIGIIAFLVQGIVFRIIHTPFLSFLLYLAIIAYVLKKFRLTIFTPIACLFKEKFLTAILLFGTLVEGFINFPSGFLYPGGHLYWSSHGHDGLWHIVVIEAIKKDFPPKNLLYAGEKIFNYHYFVDILIAEFNRLFPFFYSLDLYFRYFTFLIAFLMGIAVYSFLTTWQKNKTIGLLGVFFAYFVGSFGYLVLLIQGRGFFGGETIFWVSQGNTMIGNPPQAICFVLIPTFLLALYHYLQKNKRFFFLISYLLGGFLVGFKVYAAVVILAGLIVVALTRLFLSRRKDLLLLVTLIGFSNFMILKLISKDSSSFLVFEPWWFIRTMVVAPDRINWFDLELRRQFYLAKGGWRSFLRIAEYETIAFLIFLVGNLGVRVIGFLEIGKGLFRKTFFKEPLETTLFSAMLISFLVPLFFVQKGVAYNLIQFMQYFLLFFGFFAAVSLYSFLCFFKSKKVKIFIFIIFFALSIPTVIGNLLDFYGKNPLVIVPNQELKALTFLKNQSNEEDIILTKPFNPYAQGLYQSRPFPIYAWNSTGYVSAYTGRQTYCTDEGQMRILAINPEERIKKANAFFGLKPVYDQNGNLLHYLPADNIPLEQKTEFLKKEKINFVYLRQEETDEVQKEIFTELGLREIFGNEEVVIYEVD